MHLLLVTLRSRSVLIAKTISSSHLKSLSTPKRAMRFAANISMLFEDIPNHIDKYEELLKRTDFQFDAVEDGNPYQNSVEEWRQLLARVPNLKWILINSRPLWDRFNDVMPTREQLEALLKETADYAMELKASKVHLLMRDVKNENQIPEVTELISLAARYLQPYGLTCLLEPLSIRPNYYLRSYGLAKDIVRQLREPNVKVMLDSYHLQRLHGDITFHIEDLKPYVGHVQISQVPLRDNPMGDGEVNHRYFLKKVNEYYDDYIGLEYKNKSSDSFEWLNEFKDL